MTSDTLPDCIRFLLNPTAYPHPAEAVRLVQTHISYVLLAGDYVYKIKKPVNFGFLDFSDLQKRRHFCEQELLLNRRLCPSLYLGLSTITRQGGTLALDGPGEPVEYAVRMLRMPEEMMMSKVIERGELDRKTIDRIVAVLTPFYAAAATDAEISSFGSAKAVSVNVFENFEQTEGFVGCPALAAEQYAAIGAYARDFLTKEDLFAARLADGRIRDCHGDLYSANICLADGIFIYDCIEFNQRFRYCDVASDVAFLAMDLDFHGLPELSQYFIERFCHETGDTGLMAMLNFYKCYRAYVRGKIGLFTAHAAEVEPASKAQCLGQAGRYFSLAARYAAG